MRVSSTCPLTLPIIRQCYTRIMQLSDFHYDIPDELIAATPPAVRSTSRLLVLDRQTGTINDRRYPDKGFPNSFTRINARMLVRSNRYR